MTESALKMTSPVSKTKRKPHQWSEIKILTFCFYEKWLCTKRMRQGTKFPFFGTFQVFWIVPSNPFPQLTVHWQQHCKMNITNLVLIEDIIFFSFLFDTSLWCICQLPVKAKADANQGQELGVQTRSLPWVAGTLALEPSLMPPSMGIGRNWSQKQGWDLARDLPTWDGVSQMEA